MKNKRIVISLLFLILAALVASVCTVSAAALTPTYKVSEEYKSSAYYRRLTEIELTGDHRHDVLTVALSQLGYHEGDSDEDMDGMNIEGGRNFVEYNRMYGKVDNKEGNGVSYGYAWCAAYVSWCLRQAGVPNTIATTAISCDVMTDWYERNERFYPKETGYIPLPGDIIMFGTEDDSSHVGIVIGVKDGLIYTVEGNNGGKVDLHSYTFDNSWVYGFCQPNYTVDEGADYTAFLDESTDKLGEYVVSTANLNVRNEPDGDEIIGSLPYGTEIVVIEKVEDWGKIAYEDTEGWVHMSYATAAEHMVYTVKYHLKGGEGKEAQRKLKGDTLVITDKEPTRKGYKFLGWSKDSTAVTVDYNTGDSYSTDENMSLYAVWEPIVYTVTFYDDDGTVISEKEYKYQELLKAPEAPVKESDGTYEYAFAGWDSELAVVVVKDLEYHATYTATELEISEDSEECNASSIVSEGEEGKTEEGNPIIWAVIGVAAICLVAVIVILITKKRKHE